MNSKLLALLCASGYISIASLIFAKPQPIALEFSFVQWMTSIRTPELTTLFHGISILGEPNTIIFLSIVMTGMFLINQRPRTAVRFSITMLISIAFLYGMKAWINRPGPAPELALIQADFSTFPNEYTTLAIIFYLWNSWVITRTMKPQEQWLIRGSFILLALLIPISCLYLGITWPLDILGGILLSGIILLTTLPKLQVPKTSVEETEMTL